jgi:Uma2 family endonuclease
MPSRAESLKHFTYNDYKDWGDSIGYEILNGYAIEKYPPGGSPNIWHQRMIGGIYYQLRQFLEDKHCEVFIAPFDVKLFPNEIEEDKEFEGFDYSKYFEHLQKTLVQPDIFVVCDDTKLSNGKICKGVPDLVVEVVSATSKLLDVSTKKDLYLKAGVKEYWVVGSDLIRVNILENDTYTETVYNLEQEIPVTILPGCIIHLEKDNQKTPPRYD